MTALEDWRRLARRENRRARDVWNAGVAPDDDARAEYTVTTSRDHHALSERWSPLFEAGLTPEQIAVREQLPEAKVWQALAIHLRRKHRITTRGLPLVFYRMRCARVMTLKAAGMKRREIAALLGVVDGVFDADLKRVRDAGIDPGMVRAHRRNFHTPRAETESRRDDL